MLKIYCSSSSSYIPLSNYTFSSIYLSRIRRKKNTLYYHFLPSPHSSLNNINNIIFIAQFILYSTAVITSEGCDKSVIDDFRQKLGTSEYFCDANDDLRPFISNLFSKLPSAPLFRSSDSCMDDIKLFAEQCRQKLVQELNKPDSSGKHVKPEDMVRAILENMPCVVDSLDVNKCPKPQSRLSTVFYYGWSILPPQLGVNVSNILLQLANV